MFSLLTVTLQPLHLDVHFLVEIEWGRRFFKSLYTLGIPVGTSVNDATLGTMVANFGMTGARFPKLVFQGDTLRARTEVISLLPSQSRPESGSVKFELIHLSRCNELVTC